MSSVVAATYNTARVLRLLWRTPGISRTEMADRLGLNRSTVTIIVNELLERGLVRPVALADASPSGGRKKVRLAVNADYGCAGGVQVHADYVRVVLVDLTGLVLYQQVLAGAVHQKVLYRQLEKACAHLVQRAAQLGRRVLGIGFGLPGIVDPIEGVLLHSIPLEVATAEPIVRRLQPVLGLPLFVDNDAHCCCWGELISEREPAANFLFVLGEWRRAPHHVGALLTSIGVGVVLNRVVHYGRGFSAGEFRSIESQPEHASQFSLSDDEIAAARTDRALHLAMVRELGRNAAMLVHVLNLDRLYLGGFLEGPRADEPIDAAADARAIFREEIRRNWTYPTPPMCEVTFSTHGDCAVAYGAAGLILERAFGDPGVFALPGQEAGLALLVGA